MKLDAVALWRIGEGLPAISGDIFGCHICGYGNDIQWAEMLMSVLQFTGQADGSFVHPQIGTMWELRNPAYNAGNWLVRMMVPFLREARAKLENLAWTGQKNAS